MKGWKFVSGKGRGQIRGVEELESWLLIFVGGSNFLKLRSNLRLDTPSHKAQI